MERDLGWQVSEAEARTLIEDFKFRDLSPAVRFGTASDRYAGWIGQIYHAVS